MKTSANFITSFLFLAIASSVSANGTTIWPTSVSGGVGDVADVKANDSRAYEVAKGAVATIGDFGAYSGGTITSVYLIGEYGVDAGYNGSNAIQVNGIDTSIVPADGESARWFTLELDPAVDITNLTIGFTNNDGAQGDSVHFNYLNLLVNPTLPITMPPVLGEFVDAETPQGSLPVADSGGTTWELAFSDEFNGTSLDTTKWGIDVSSSSRNPRPTQGIADWWWKSENVTIDGSGFVELHVTKEDSNTMHCGSISSDGLYEPQYGYLEARIKIADTTKSTHTAFWLQGPNMNNSDPADGTANDGAEVDIFESAWFGDYTKSVVHYDGYDSDHRANTKQYSTPNLHSGYHVFGLEWTADSMKIYYDGVLKVTYTGIWVPQVQEWLWLSVGASFGDVGSFASAPVGWLTSAEVDYVRVWQEFVDTTPPAADLLSPNDDATSVAVSSNLVITFDENIVAGTGLITLKNLTDATEITMAVTDGARVTISGATMTINPAADLEPGKDYAVQIAATAIDDLAGRSFAGIADDTTWNFTAMTPGASVIYEPFTYSNGAIDGTQGGATGTTGNWTQTGGSGLFNVVTPSLSFNGLASTGGATRRTSATGGSEIAIGMSSAAQTALLADNTSIYFSLLIETRTFSQGNENLAFAIGTGAFDDNDQDKVLPTITGGEGIGVVFDNGTDTVGGQQIAGFLIDGGAAAASAGVVSVGSTVDTYMIVGRIDWAANGSSDTLTLYNIAEPSGELAPELPGSPFATMTADLDQSLFDTMTIADRQVGTIDEIRFGTTLADVGIAGGAPGNTFADWIAGYTVGGLSGFGDDPDNDSIQNGLESYFGTDPSVSSGQLMAGLVYQGGGTFTFTHPIGDTPPSDITASYRWSKDLATFHDDGATDGESTTVTFSQGTPSDGEVEVTVTVTGTAISKLFVVIQVTTAQ